MDWIPTGDATSSRTLNSSVLSSLIISLIRFRNLPITQSRINLFGANNRSVPASSSACRGLIQVLNCCEGISAFKHSMHFCQVVTTTLNLPTFLLLESRVNSNHKNLSYPLARAPKTGFLKPIYSFILQQLKSILLINTEAKK